MRESQEMVGDPRARLFVLFLDTYHVSRDGAWTVRRSLSRLLEKVIGQNDFVAVMTPEMSAGAVTFTRRTGTIDELLDKWITWGKRHEEVMNPDPVESRYQFCYPPQPGEGSISAIAQEMTARRREQMTLDAMRDLIVHLTGLREERKAILMVSEGWALYRPNSSLARPVDGRIPGPQPVGVGVNGGLQMGDPSRNAGGATNRECDTDRMMLAQEDHDRQFRELLDEANRGNASFYTIDPRGLPVFDSPISAPLPPALDQAMLHARLESLQTLAVATDGMAVLNSNDIDKGLRRVVDDLTSYYLLGYYSATAKPDGRFHAINVKVKRPGVNVRARRGYRSATRAEMESDAKAMAAAKADVSPATRVIGTLSKIRTDAFVHATAGYEWGPSPSGAPVPSLWVATELDSNAAAREEAWRAGADVSIVVTAADKSTVQETTQTLKREQRAAVVRIPLPPTPGDYAIKHYVEARGRHARQHRDTPRGRAAAAARVARLRSADAVPPRPVLRARLADRRRPALSAAGAGEDGGGGARFVHRCRGAAPRPQWQAAVEHPRRDRDARGERPEVRVRRSGPGSAHDRRLHPRGHDQAGRRRHEDPGAVSDHPLTHTAQDFDSQFRPRPPASVRAGLLAQHLVLRAQIRCRICASKDSGLMEALGLSPIRQPRKSV